MRALGSIKKRFQILGEAPALNRAIAMAAEIAPTSLSILITGENGTGKESFAKIIHHLSPRKHAHFVAVNCGAIPEGTMESELFGHEKGSFTGASESRKGYFEEAHKGTLFLDEIGEMPSSSQPRLLRVLENQEFLPVGSSKKRTSDARVITATNVHLPQRVAQGTFREDLYYRIAQVTIPVPSLRERAEDIPLLFRKFTLDFAHEYRTKLVQLTPEAEQILSQYPFPGNVRQLKNIAWQMAALEHKTPLISKEKIAMYLPNPVPTSLPALSTESNFSPGEREMLYKTLFKMQEETDHLKEIIQEMLRNHEQGQTILRQYPVLFKDFPQGEKHKEEPPQLVSAPAGAEIPPAPLPPPPSRDSELSITLQEKILIEKALTKWKNRKQAAQELGIGERTLYRKIKAYDL